MRFTKVSAIAAATLFSISLAACGNDEGTGGGATTAQSAAPMATATSAAPSMSATMTNFGAGCAAVPTEATDPGSFAGMAGDPVATAASNNPVLGTLVKAVKQAGLVDSLNTAPALTVFAPTNDAFGKIPEAALKKVLADKKQLTGILTYHVVAGKLSPEKLAGTHKTLNGAEVTVAGSGEDFKVGGTASVICGNVQTANATVYIIDSVLMPKS
jgi:uncharacterized surface protein with fasciclin (FAS1) repeats